MGLLVINEHDIEAFREDAEVFETVKQRVLKGVPKHREINAEEFLPFFRHSLRLEGWLSMALDEQAARNAVAMSPGEPEAKYGSI
jgi:hypothetical protein